MVRNHFKFRKGMALLMAVLVSGLFFVISAAIFKTSLIELVLSAIGRDSQVAFYWADTGIEGALYYSYKYQGGDDSGDAFSIYNNGGPDADSNRERLVSGVDPMILGNSVVTELRQGDFIAGGFHQTHYKVQSLDSSNIGCAEIVVSKFRQKNPDVPATPDDSVIAKTTITARGYNICDPVNPKRIERAIKATLE